MHCITHIKYELPIPLEQTSVIAPKGVWTGHLYRKGERRVKRGVGMKRRRKRGEGMRKRRKRGGKDSERRGENEKRYKEKMKSTGKG